MIKHIGRLKLHDSQEQEWVPVLWSVSLFSCVPAVHSAGQDGVGPLADAVARNAPALRPVGGEGIVQYAEDGKKQLQKY